MDASVYSQYRLFRCVNQPGVDKNEYKADLVTMDKHKLITDSDIKETVITYIDPAVKYIDLYSTHLSYKDHRKIQKTFNKNKRNNFSNEYKVAPAKQVFIFNHPVNKDDIASLLDKKEDTPDGKAEYDKAVVLSELMTPNETNTKMITLLNEFIEYYKNNGSYKGFRLTIQQIGSIEKIIESKI